MKKEEVFINLNKCSAKEQIHIFSLLPPEPHRDAYNIFKGYTYLHFIPKSKYQEKEKWMVDRKVFDKTELTYPEFIKLFEGGEGENENIYDVDFGGNVIARIKIVDNKIEVTNAMNGYGNGIPLSEITITNSNQ